MFFIASLYILILQKRDTISSICKGTTVFWENFSFAKKTATLRKWSSKRKLYIPKRHWPWLIDFFFLTRSKSFWIWCSYLRLYIHKIVSTQRVPHSVQSRWRFSNGRKLSNSINWKFAENWTLDAFKNIL